MPGPFEDDDEADAAARARGRNDHDSTHVDAAAQDQIKAFVERIERMEEEKSVIAEDIREIYAEAKGTGFDTKVLRKVIARRKMDKAERDEQDALLELYEGVFG